MAEYTGYTYVRFSNNGFIFTYTVKQPLYSRYNQVWYNELSAYNEVKLRSRGVRYNWSSLYITEIYMV